MEPIWTRQKKKDSKIQTRSMVNETTRRSSGERAKKSPSMSISEMKRKSKQRISDEGITEIRDPFQSAIDAVGMVRGETGIIYDNRMAEHLCLWDRNYPECPERFTEVMNR